MTYAFTAEDVLTAGILPDATDEDAVWVGAGLNWMEAHTTFRMDGRTLDRIPPGAKIFLRKYRELIEQFGISSESIEGLSQSFTSDALDDALKTLADTLLPEYAPPAVTFYPKSSAYKYVPPHIQPRRWGRR